MQFIVRSYQTFQVVMILMMVLVFHCYAFWSLCKLWRCNSMNVITWYWLWLGVTTGRVCAQLGPDSTYSGGGKYGPKTDLVIWSDFPVQVLLVLGCIGSGIGFIARNNFWSGSASSGRNLVGSVEIWPRFRRIMARSRWILSGMLNISSETLKVSEIWSGMLNI